MPKIGWLCVYNDEERTFNDCIACSKTDKHCEFTPEMLILMKKGGGGKKDPRSSSPTGLLSVRRCQRKMVLASRYDYHTSPRKDWFLFRGNMIHSILEGVYNKDAWTEIMQSRDIEIPSGGVVTIWGKTDKIVQSKLMITDYKTSSRIPTKKEGVFGEHDWQLNFYRWLWWPVFQAERLRLQYIDMRGTKQVKVDIIPIEEVEKEIRRCADIYYQIMTNPGVPSGEYDEKVWSCRYCDVQEVCRKLNREERHGKKTEGNNPSISKPKRGSATERKREGRGEVSRPARRSRRQV